MLEDLLDGFRSPVVAIQIMQVTGIIGGGIIWIILATGYEIGLLCAKPQVGFSSWHGYNTEQFAIAPIGVIYPFGYTLELFVDTDHSLIF